MPADPPSRHARPVLAALALAGIAALGGCSGGAPDRTELVEALETSGVPAAAARCTADALVDTLDDDQLALLAERGPGGAPRDDPDRTDDTSDRLREALTACREELPTTTGTSTTVTPTTTAGTVPTTLAGGAPSTSGPAFDTVPPTGGESTTVESTTVDSTTVESTAAP
ncbi:MAG TPA: hypothetical protein VHK88_20485 [Aquihabitans sp.]|jgi:hypothetical protein|nr:hypothetical protein [Aquihabitans sp.]